VDNFQFPEEQMTLSLAQLIVDGLHGQSNSPSNKKNKRLAIGQKKR
jgi:hypothetical protein